MIKIPDTGVEIYGNVENEFLTANERRKFCTSFELLPLPSSHRQQLPRHNFLYNFSKTFFQNFI